MLNSRIEDMGLIPVVVVNEADDAPKIAEALHNGGIDIMEITLRTKEGIQAIKRVKSECPYMLVGAGTVLSIGNTTEAVDAGAEFIVSPGFNADIVEWCIDRKIDVIPGVATPTEIQNALVFGLDVFKFFPAGIYGGVNGCKALHGPFPMIKFIPTGGIDINSMADYADKSYIYAIGGGWMCKGDLVKARNFEGITNIARQSVDVLLGFEIDHVGVNTGSEKAALKTAEALAGIFRLEMKNGNSSVFSGSRVEIMKKTGKGALGHIGVKTNSIKRAVYYLAKRGFEIDRDTIKADGKRIKAVYLKDTVEGLAIHLMEK